MKHNINNISAMLLDSEKFSGEKIRYFEEIESTNSWMLAQSQCGDQIDGTVCLAEKQRAGKGRRGKAWVTPASCSVLMSLGWRLENKNPAGLSLVSGLAVAQALEQLGVKNVSLKWPNDIIAERRKLGGILVEISEFDCVIGVGINVNIPASFEMPVDQPWVDLRSLGLNINRDQLVAQIVLSHEQLLYQYESCGFSSLADKWNTLHAYQNQVVDIVSANEPITGIALGVDEAGALLVQINHVTHRITSGEVSVRPSTSG